MKLYAPRLIQICIVIASFAASLLGLTACQDFGDQNRPSGSVVVKIPVYENGSYVLKSVRLETVTDMVNLRGEAAQFLYSPSVRNGELVGYEPRIRTLRNSSGEYIAQDSLSIQALSLYANFESLMRLDEMVGVKSELKWPGKIGLMTRVPTPEGQSSNNARYSGVVDAMLFEPFTKGDLPLAVNEGVIAHEHFHAIFYRRVLVPLGDKFNKSGSANVHDMRDWNLAVEDTRLEESDLSDREQYHTTLLRGINEGLADVWGWIHSGDPDFVVRSLKIAESTRNLKGERLGVPNSDDFMRDSVRGLSERKRMDRAYGLGTAYARAIYQWALAGKEDMDPVRRVTLAKVIVDVLPHLQISLKALGSQELLEPGELIVLLSKRVDFQTEAGCKALRQAVPMNLQKQICNGRFFSALDSRTRGVPR